MSKINEAAVSAASDMMADRDLWPHDDPHRANFVTGFARNVEVSAMETAELTWRLERARRAVAESETAIRCQRDLIFRLERAREDATAARALLKTLLEREAERQKNLSFIMRQFPPEN